VQIPVVHDHLQRRNRPEAIAEENGVGDEQENRDP
jgi:hypothetical protein